MKLLKLNPIAPRAARGRKHPGRAGLIGAGLAALMFTFAGTGASRADDVSDFYSGKTITVLIGYSAGGGYDTYGRLVAKYLGDHIPGHPQVIAQNLPGAGSLKAALYLYSAAPKDGTVIGTFGRSIPLDPLINPDHSRFDASKLAWLGSVTSDVSLCVTWNTSKIKQWSDLLKTEAVFGGNQSGSDPDIFALGLKGILGAKIRLVTGYPGSSDIALAMERGEIDGMCGMSYSTLRSRHPEWITDKKVNLIVQAALKKDPDLADVPLVLDLAKKPEQKKLLKLLVASQSMARPFAAPGGIPADRLAALRKAFDETVHDPKFVADAEKLKLDVKPVGAEEVQSLLDDLYATPPALLAVAVKVFNGESLETAMKETKK